MHLGIRVHYVNVVSNIMYSQIHAWIMICDISGVTYLLVQGMDGVFIDVIAGHDGEVFKPRLIKTVTQKLSYMAGPSHKAIFSMLLCW